MKKDLLSTDQLRREFLDFFKSKQHKIVASDSLVPTDDPTVLFTSAGMNQFKKKFLGDVGDFRRAASSQKCLRTGDLDKVGRTSSHHTFFEMLGNFSFGDYFKKDAIIWAWEFMTEVLKVPDDKLWVSVYKDDDEAYKIWRDDIKIPKERIVKLGDKENFWPANAIAEGPNGPCGPCSEIFYDRGEDVGCKKKSCSLVCSCGRFVEIWNLVFTQFNRVAKNKLEPLPQKNIDTGMGLERMAAVLQGKKTNFEIDIFQPIIKEIKDTIYIGLTPNEEIFNTIADHIRAIVFAISDGVMPSNEGRGYIVRKLIRRAFLEAKALRNDKPFIHKIVPSVVETMKAPYPGIEDHRENISLIIKAEEERFNQALKEGERVLAEMKSLSGKKELSAEEAFKLYDTYGYPLDLLKEKGVKFDQKKVNNLLDKQRAQSRKASVLPEDVFAAASTETVSSFKTEFVGYTKDITSAKILAVIDNSQIVLDRTPFYAESGGQVGDKGKIESSNALAEVYDTKKINNAIVHYVNVIKGSFKENEKITASVDKERRLDIARHHTATHLLQSALRRVLGSHVRQQGSLVSGEYLRFDFTHFKSLTEEELLRVEELVDEYICANDNVIRKEMLISDAKKSGALAFFADKYQETVRVISVADYSKEFCGGTHLDNTGQIGLFKIISEGSIASGVRRIEAICGRWAYKKIQDEEFLIKELTKEFNVSKGKLKQEIDDRLGYIKKLEKDLSNSYLKLFTKDIPQLIKKIAVARGVNLLVLDVKVRDMQQMRSSLDLLKNKIKKPFIIFLFSKFDGEGLFITAVSGDLAERGLDTKRIISEMGLKGGGGADLAQGGMNNKDWRQKQDNWEILFTDSKKIEKAIGDML